MKLSNGSTSVLLSVLLLSGSALAQSPWEKELITWLAEHDQDVFGLGVVGFDLDEIAWDSQNFAIQKDFFLRIIDLALSRHGWERLTYDPPFVADQLRVLRRLVEIYCQEFVEPSRGWDWKLRPSEFIKCPLHQVYMHSAGCLICNDH